VTFQWSIDGQCYGKSVSGDFMNNGGAIDRDYCRDLPKPIRHRHRTPLSKGRVAEAGIDDGSGVKTVESGSLGSATTLGGGGQIRLK
jgi:hypothetical protein